MWPNSQHVRNLFQNSNEVLHRVAPSLFVGRAQNAGKYCFGESGNCSHFFVHSNQIQFARFSLIVIFVANGH
jgi:hypothetical protein